LKNFAKFEKISMSRRNFKPEEKNFQIFFKIFQKFLYGNLFHRKWNIFRKKNLELFFEKICFGQNFAQKIKNFC